MCGKKWDQIHARARGGGAGAGAGAGGTGGGAGGTGGGATAGAGGGATAGAGAGDDDVTLLVHKTFDQNAIQIYADPNLKPGQLGFTNKQYVMRDSRGNNFSPTKCMV